MRDYALAPHLSKTTGALAARRGLISRNRRGAKAEKFFA